MSSAGWLATTYRVTTHLAACRTAQDAQEAEDRYGAIFHSRSDLALYSRGYGWYSKGKWADRVVPGGVLRGTDRTVKLGRYHPVPRSVPLEIWISPRSTPGTTRTPSRRSYLTTIMPPGAWRAA